MARIVDKFGGAGKILLARLRDVRGIE